MRRKRLSKEDALADATSVETVDAGSRPNAGPVAARELRRHWARYFAAALVITLVFAAVASMLPTSDEPVRYEALVVAIGQDPVAGAARRTFDSEDFARTVIDQVSSPVHPDVLTSEILTLRTEAGSSTISIEAIEATPEAAKVLSEAAAEAMSRSLEELGFFTRQLEATQLRDPARITPATLVVSLLAACLSVLGWVAVASSRTRTETPLTQQTSAAPQTGLPTVVWDPKPDVPRDDAAERSAQSDEQNGRSSPLDGQSKFLLPAVREPGNDERALSPDVHHEVAGDLQARLRIALLLEKSFGDNHPRVRALGGGEIDSTAADLSSPASRSVLNGVQADAVLDELDPDGSGSELITHITGIGPVYSSRLEALGITTCEQLANCDPEAVAESVGARAANVEDWVAQARALTLPSEWSVQPPEEA